MADYVPLPQVDQTVASTFYLTKGDDVELSKENAVAEKHKFLNER